MILKNTTVFSGTFTSHQFNINCASTSTGKDNNKSKYNENFDSAKISFCIYS